jgi:hypothetical protein
LCFKDLILKRPPSALLAKAKWNEKIGPYLSRIEGCLRVNHCPAFKSKHSTKIMFNFLLGSIVIGKNASNSTNGSILQLYGRLRWARL